MSYLDNLELDNQNLSALRERALDNFTSLGLPTVRHEEWKFTNIKKIFDEDYSKDASSSLDQSQIDACFIPELEGERIVFVNGKYIAEHSSITPEKGVTIQTFADAAEQNPEVFAKYYSKQTNIDEEAITALSTAFAQDGAFILVEKNVIVEKSITLYFISDATSQQVVSYPRNLFVVQENAQAKFAEVISTIGDQKSLVNAVTEIVVEKSAIAEHYKIQNDTVNASQLSLTQVVQAEKSVFKQHTYALQGNIIRNNLNIALDGEHIETYMNGLYLLNGSTHVDNHTAVDHRFPNCESHELYKGIVDDTARGVFNGKIFVRKDAQKTNAFQSNRNVLLSDTATINTKPQLEIWADDVSCSHGCTIGQLDEEALFYMKSRGIGERKAKALLMKAFALEVVDRITIEAIKNHIERLIDERLD